MEELTLKQKRQIVQTAVSCGIMNPGIAKLQEDVKAADDIIGLYWMKYNSNDGYWYARVPNLNKGGKKSLIKRKNRDDLEEAILRAHFGIDKKAPKQELVKKLVTPEEVNSFQKMYEEWRAFKLRIKEHMKSTAIRNDSCYKKFLQDEEWTKRDISKVTPIQVRKWLKITIADKEPTIKEYTNLHAIINGVFQYALDEGHITEPIAPFISGLGKNRKLFTPCRSQLPEYDESQVFTKDEAAKIMKQLRYDNINDLGIRLLFWTGLRVGELVALRWEDFSQDCSEIIVRRRQTSEKLGDRYIHPIVNHTKGIGTYRRVLVPPQEIIPILESVKKLNPDGEYLFSKNGEVLTPATFSGRLRRVCRWAGVEYKSLHKIRKTVVTELMDHQVPLPVIQGQVGHASASTTESFYHFNNKTKKENGRKIALALGDFLPLTAEMT